MSSFPLRLLRGFLSLCFNSPVIRGTEWAVSPLGLRDREVPKETEKESWWMQISSPHPHPIPGLACLHIATLQRNRPLMELLLQNGADIDTQVRGPIRARPRACPPPDPAPGSLPSGQQWWHSPLPYAGPRPSTILLDSSRGPWLISFFPSRRAPVEKQHCTWLWRPRSGA